MGPFLNNFIDLSEESELSDLPDLVEDDDFFYDDDNKVLSSPCFSPQTPSSIAWSSPITPQRKKVQSFTLREYTPRHKIGTRNQAVLEMSKRKFAQDVPLSPIEVLPNEIIQKIAGVIDNDTDVRNLNLSSPTFSKTVSKDESGIWRTRFLAKYDYPTLDHPHEFSIAYKLRRLILKNFVDYSDGMNRRTEMQLEVLRDMILETYFNPKLWLPPPTKSRNLQAFENTLANPWIIVFFKTPFPGVKQKKRWGEPHRLFETAQLALSHLLLSPRSSLSHLATSSRENYDLVRVYAFNQPLTTLFTCSTMESTPASPSASLLFPNLRLRDESPPLQVCNLDTTSLHHIRNYWHRHLIDDSHPGGEHTYADMMRCLSKRKRLPQRWEQSLDSKIEISNNWVGHYSCLHPWPKARKDLEERQSCAEDWTNVDPMMLDFVTSSDFKDGFWPPAFSTIPIFEETVPGLPDLTNLDLLAHTTTQTQRSKPKPTSQHHTFPREGDKPIYIRGIAPFINTQPSTSSTETSTDPTTTAQTPESFLKHHSFTALRIRGVLHHIPSSATVGNKTKHEDQTIPGWTRVVMVLYKPTPGYLVNVLEHDAGDYGGAFGTQVTGQANTASVWVAASAGSTGGSVNTAATGPTTATAGPGVGTVQPTVQAQTQTQTQPTPSTSTNTNTNTGATTQSQPQQPDLHTALQTRLSALLTSATTPIPPPPPASSNPTLPLPTTQIIALEDAYIPASYLSWDDGTIDFAYAYEGIILPGGKIMFGRWWRMHGSLGGGAGKEVDASGEAVVGREHDGEEGGDGEEESCDADDEGEGDGVGNGEREGETEGSEEERPGWQALERGPFVFWA